MINLLFLHQMTFRDTLLTKKWLLSSKIIHAVKGYQRYKELELRDKVALNSGQYLLGHKRYLRRRRFQHDHLK
ncbi:hypothetical protein ACS0TY_030425 [Phlomoides rotata]